MHSSTADDTRARSSSVSIGRWFRGPYAVALACGVVLAAPGVLVLLVASRTEPAARTIALALLALTIVACVVAAIAHQHVQSWRTAAGLQTPSTAAGVYGVFLAVIVVGCSILRQDVRGLGDGYFDVVALGGWFVGAAIAAALAFRALAELLSRTPALSTAQASPGRDLTVRAAAVPIFLTGIAAYLMASPLGQRNIPTLIEANATIMHGAELAHDSLSPRARHLLGLALVRTGLDYTAGAAALFAAARLAPGDAWTQADAGYAALGTNDGRRAVAYLRRALQLRPKLVEARRYLPQALLAANRDTEAVAAAREAVASEPNDIDALLSLAAALYATRADSEGGRVIDRAERLDPKNVRIWETRAFLLKTRGHLDQALALYERAAAVDTRNARLWAELGLTAYLTQHPVRALEALHLARDLDPRFTQYPPYHEILNELEGGAGADSTVREAIERLKRGDTLRVR